MKTIHKSTQVIINSSDFKTEEEIKRVCHNLVFVSDDASLPNCLRWRRKDKNKHSKWRQNVIIWRQNYLHCTNDQKLINWVRSRKQSRQCGGSIRLPRAACRDLSLVTAKIFIKRISLNLTLATITNTLNRRWIAKGQWLARKIFSFLSQTKKELFWQRTQVFVVSRTARNMCHYIVFILRSVFRRFFLCFTKPGVFTSRTRCWWSHKSQF